MKIIYIHSPKYGTKEVLVDDEDYELLIKLKWAITTKKDSSIFYAIKSRTRGEKMLSMHRFIMKESDPKTLIDHKDHNTLNNQKSNLRKATASQNNVNTTPTGGSKYLGVTLCNSKYKNRITPYYKASTRVKGVTYYLGSLPYTEENEIIAAKRYDMAAKYFHEEFANLNFK